MIELLIPISLHVASWGFYGELEDGSKYHQIIVNDYQQVLYVDGVPYLSITNNRVSYYEKDTP